MIYEIITAEQADADLRGIYEYIAFELLSPDHAAGQLERLEEHIAWKWCLFTMILLLHTAMIC